MGSLRVVRRVLIEDLGHAGGAGLRCHLFGRRVTTDTIGSDTALRRRRDNRVAGRTHIDLGQVGVIVAGFAKLLGHAGFSSTPPSPPARRMSRSRRRT